MSQPPHSPPRRARPVPQIPSPYLSADFSAAAQAVHLIENPNPNLYATITSLRTLREQISTSLHSTAPPWPALTPAIAALQTALQTTQSASQLRQTLNAMRDNIPTRDNYPTRMASAVHRAAQLSANVSLANSVREFAHMLRAADVPDSNAFSPSPHPSTTPHPMRTHTASAPSPRRPAQSFQLPDRFLQRAAALHRARAAASSAPLTYVTALDDARTSLTAQHVALQTELEAILQDAIYASVDPAADPPGAAAEGTHSFAPASTPKTPSAPPSPLPADIFPSLVQAVDLLGGTNHAASVLAEAAPNRLMALVRDALVADPVLPSSTIASMPPSSFTTPSLSAKCLHPFPNSPIAQPMHVFDNELSHVSRLSCAAVFERVRMSMTAVLRRLSALAEAVDCKGSTIFEAVQQIWHVMEATLVSFVHAMLAFPTPKPSTSPFDQDAQLGHDSRPGRISLLPLPPRQAAHAPAESTPGTWQLERTQTSLDSFTALVHSITTLTPSIYNLEVAYSPLQQFIMMSTRLQHAWKEHGAQKLAKTTPSSSPLSQVLVRAVDLFMSTVRKDVCKYMQTVLGNRAGTLLQPCSRRQRRAAPGAPLLANAVHAKDDGDTDRSHLLPLLPQSQMVINVIASCLSLGVAVPSIASRIGDVVNRDVILPFCERAIYALDLVGAWSDGGFLFREMWDHVSSDDSSRAEETDSNAESETTEGKPSNPASPEQENGKHMGRILSAMRSEGGLTTQCLGQICKREPWRIRKTNLLMENEWNAVVRLVANAKIIISQLESCVGKSGDSAVNRMIMDSAASHSGDPGDCFKLISLRGILRVRGISSNLHGPIVEAIQRTQTGCRMLREEVIEKGLIVLHCEVVLHCFSRAVRTLIDDAADLESRQRGCMGFDDGKLCGNGDTKGINCGVGNGGGGNGLSRPSSIFKALPIQLSDVERTSEEESGGMNEFDEFGDRIAIGSESVTEAEIEECAFPNSLLLEQTDWKGGAGNEGHGHDAVQTVTKSDKRAIHGGRAFGEDVKVMDECIRHNLGEIDRTYVLNEADEGVGLGIRISGEIRGQGDRDVATGTRLFMDAAATVAADTLGWPVVDSDYSVAEGASHSASECRTLLFAAGML